MSFFIPMIAAQLTDLEKPAARALSLQFILHEYARALEIASKFSKSSIREMLQGLNQLYPDLAEGTPTLKLGLLRKLCFYCEALLETSHRGEELLHVLDDLQLMAARERRTKVPSSSVFDKLRTFFPPLSRQIAECKERCEAPLFALLELRKPLNKHLGSGAVERLLQTLFSSPQELHQAISLGFAQRGFEGFCKQHEHLFEDLAWEPLIEKL